MRCWRIFVKCVPFFDGRNILLTCSVVLRDEIRTNGFSALFSSLVVSDK
jgi:hypothetical protein